MSNYVRNFGVKNHYNNNNNNNPICKVPECQKTSVALPKSDNYSSTYSQ